MRTPNSTASIAFVSRTRRPAERGDRVNPFTLQETQPMTDAQKLLAEARRLESKARALSYTCYHDSAARCLRKAAALRQQAANA